MNINNSSNDDNDDISSLSLSSSSSSSSSSSYLSLITTENSVRLLKSESETEIIRTLEADDYADNCEDDNGNENNDDDDDGDDNEEEMDNDDDNTINDWEYAKNGIIMWLNNDPNGAEKHFKAKKNRNIKIFAGYTFITVMNAVISYELDKIEMAQLMLKELEQRCYSTTSTNNVSDGWFQSVRMRIFGSKQDINVCNKSSSLSSSSIINNELEEKIILADCLMCSAILTFLTQDISGLMKGSWLLRKAWKIYQQTYSQIYEIHTTLNKKLPNENEMTTSSRTTIATSESSISIRPISPMDTDSDLSSVDENTQPIPINIVVASSSSSMESHNYRSSMIRSKTTNVIDTLTKSNNRHPLGGNNNIFKKSLNQIQTESTTIAKHVISHLPSKIRLDKIHHATNKKYSPNLSPPSLPSSSKSSLHYDGNQEEYSSHPSKKNLFLDLSKSNSKTSHKNGFIRQVPLSCPSEPASKSFTPTTTFANISSHEINNMNSSVIKRLMGAISFGYGLFQLSISLLPPSLMRLITLFGFEGDKNFGISCLTYSNNSEDMRAPLARLALLWYYTIGAQLFHIEGSNMKKEIFAAKQLLKESQENYTTSAIFLFFRARVKRLQCNTNIAIDFYDAAYRMSAQKELKLLCLHEVGWCRLIQLDFGNAWLHFHELRLASNFSKNFYTYMTTISQGAFGRFDNILKLRNELLDIINKHKNRETQIDKFILRRINKLPSKDNQRELFNMKYYKFFIYEMLFLWNTLYSCSDDVLNGIITDCSYNDDNRESNNSSNSNISDVQIEPFVGISELILGCCQGYLKNFNLAKNSLRKCIRKREGLTDYVHISAYAHYELAIILLKEQRKHSEQQISSTSSSLSSSSLSSSSSTTTNANNSNNKSSSNQEAKQILLNAQRSFRNYDFENRLNAKIYSILKTLQ